VAAFTFALCGFLTALGLSSAEKAPRVHVACYSGAREAVEAFRGDVGPLVPLRVETLRGEAPESPGERCVLTLLQQGDPGFTRFFELPRHEIAAHEHMVAAFRDEVHGSVLPVLQHRDEPVHEAGGVVFQKVVEKKLANEAKADRRRTEAVPSDDPFAVPLILDTMLPIEDDALAVLQKRMERPLGDAELVEQSLSSAGGASETSAKVLRLALSVLTTLRRDFGDDYHLCSVGEVEVGRRRKHALFRSPGLHVHPPAAAEVASQALFAFDNVPKMLSKVCGVVAIAVLSDAPGAVNVEKLERETALNGEANFVIQSGVDDFLPIWKKQLLGEGEVIGVSDTGLDQDTCFMRDAQKGPIPVSEATAPITDLSRRKVVQYLTFSRGDDQDIDDGHGTHVTGTALGAIEGASPGETRYDGIAFRAKTAFFDLQDEGTAQSSRNAIRTPSDIIDIFESAFDEAGARLHTNSWGSATNAVYDSRSRALDEFMFDHDSLLILYAAGNCGERLSGCINSGDGSLFSPAIAKNVLAVGASHTGDGAYTQSIDRVAYFSSRGCGAYDDNASPSSNCRIKPDVLGPGFVVRSAAADPLRASCSVYTSAGTSMATPVIAGGAALIREYFRRGFYPFGAEGSGPELLASGMLVKAMLVASAVGVDFLESSSGQLTALGPPPDNIQGHGRVQLDTVLPFGGLGLFVQDRRSIAEGEVQAFEVVVALSSTVPLTATIAWYESGQTFSSFNSNDLDIRIEEDGASGGTGVYYPNGLSEPDRVNNVEKVYFNPTPGQRYHVFVTATTVEGGGQWNYSLVVTGDLAAADALRAPPTNAPVPSPTLFPTRAPSPSPTFATLYRVAVTCFLCDAFPSDSLSSTFGQAVQTTLQNLSTVETDVNVDASARVSSEGNLGTAFAYHAAVTGPFGDADEVRSIMAESDDFRTSVLDLTEVGTGQTFSCFQIWNVTISAASDETPPARREESEKLGQRTRSVLIYFQTAVGLTAMSGFTLLLVILLLGYSAYVGCCADPQRDLSITEMPHLWTERLHAWHAKQQGNRPSRKTRTIKRSLRHERRQLAELRQRGTSWRAGEGNRSPLVTRRQEVRKREGYDEEKAADRPSDLNYAEEKKEVQVFYPGASRQSDLSSLGAHPAFETISPITGKRGPHRSPTHGRTKSEQEGDALQAVMYERGKNPNYLEKANPMRFASPYSAVNDEPEITIFKPKSEAGGERVSSSARDRHMEAALALGRPPALIGVRQQVGAVRRNPITHPAKRSTKNSAKVQPTGDLPENSEAFREQLRSLRQLGATREEAVKAITAFKKSRGQWASPVDLWLAQTTPEGLGRAMETALSGELQDFESDEEDELKAAEADAERERERRADAEYRNQLQRLQALGAAETIAVDAITTWKQNPDKYDSPEEVWMHWTTPDAFGQLQPKKKKKQKKKDRPAAAQSNRESEATREMRNYGFGEAPGRSRNASSPERKTDGKNGGRWSTSYLLNI